MWTCSGIAMTPSLEGKFDVDFSKKRTITNSSVTRSVLRSFYVAPGKSVTLSPANESGLLMSLIVAYSKMYKLADLAKEKRPHDIPILCAWPLRTGPRQRVADMI